MLDKFYQVYQHKLAYTSIYIHTSLFNKDKRGHLVKTIHTSQIFNLIVILYVKCNFVSHNVSLFLKFRPWYVSVLVNQCIP